MNKEHKVGSFLNEYLFVEYFFIVVVTSVQRSLSDGGQPFSTEQVGVLQVTSQQISPNPSSSPTSQFYPPNLKGTQVVSPSSNLPSNQIRVQQSLHNPAVSLQQQNDGGKPPQQSPLHAKLQSESVSHLTSTPRLQFTTPRPALQAYAQTIRPGEGPEINRQLRDLLQKQQFKKLDEQLLPGKGQQRVWPPNEGLQDVDQTHAISAPGDTTFRHPLPPGIARPRSAVSTTGMMLRQPGTVVGVRMPDPDTRMQNVDFRTRLILQQVIIKNTLDCKFQLYFFLAWYCSYKFPTATAVATTTATTTTISAVSRKYS